MSVCTGLHHFFQTFLRDVFSVPSHTVTVVHKFCIICRVWCVSSCTTRSPFRDEPCRIKFTLRSLRTDVTFLPRVNRIVSFSSVTVFPNQDSVRRRWGFSEKSWNKYIKILTLWSTAVDFKLTQKTRKMLEFFFLQCKPTSSFFTSEFSWE